MLGDGILGEGGEDDGGLTDGILLGEGIDGGALEGMDGGDELGIWDGGGMV